MRWLLIYQLMFVDADHTLHIRRGHEIHLSVDSCEQAQGELWAIGRIRGACISLEDVPAKSGPSAFQTVRAIT